MNYLEPGHTFMAADSTHAAIHKQAAVYDFEDLTRLVATSRRSIKCTTLSHTDMRVYENNAKKVATTLRQLKVVEFRRGSTSMFTKRSFSDNFREEKFLKKKEEADIIALTAEGKSTTDTIIKMELQRGVSSLKKEIFQVDVCSACAQEGVFWRTSCER